jgi:membrane fusion protein (multidrug efflux system)
MLNYTIVKNFSFLIFLMFAIASCGEKEQATAPPPQINVVESMSEDVSIYTEFVGEVYGEKDISIRARVEGYLEGIFFDEGSEVKEGQMLYSIDPRPL